MIHFKTGDILEENAEALVNTVNCVGAMGRGIALQFKKSFPRNFRFYADACKRSVVRPGHMLVFETHALANPRYIINFPTKRHWRARSRIEDIRAGLADLVRVIRERGIRSIAVPPLGSGLGGLEWETVRRHIEEALGGVGGVEITVFEPTAGEAPTRVGGHGAPRMTVGRAALVGLVERYLEGGLEPFVTLLEVHKLMYFMQLAGEPLKLRFRKAFFGPYAENLRHVLNAVEGHFLSGYADGGDAPGKPLELVEGAAARAGAVLEGSPETRDRFDRVSDLIRGFESAFGLELLSTVHWTLSEDLPESHEELVRRTHAWNPGKERFASTQIRRVAEVLAEKGWIGRCGTGWVATAPRR